MSKLSDFIATLENTSGMTQNQIIEAAALKGISANAGMVSRELKAVGKTYKPARGTGETKVKTANVETVKVNPAEQASSMGFISSALKKALVGSRVLMPSMPKAWLENQDGMQQNPEFIAWFNVQEPAIHTAIQGNVTDSDFDAGMFLLGVNTSRRQASIKAQQDKEQQAIAQATAMLVSSGHIVIKATDFASAIEYAASKLLHPTNEAIYEAFSSMFMKVEAALEAYDGTGYQYTGEGCLDSGADMVNLLTREQRGCPHVLWYRLNLGEGTKSDKADETKRSKAIHAQRTVNLGADIHAQWQAYHAPYQATLDAQRTKERKQALLSQIIEENPDLDLAEVLSRLKQAQAA